MGYSLEKNVWVRFNCDFGNSCILRMACQSNCNCFAQSMVDKRILFGRLFFGHNKSVVEDLSQSWATPLKICLGAVFYRGFNMEVGHLGHRNFNKDMDFLRTT